MMVSPVTLTRLAEAKNVKPVLVLSTVPTMPGLIGAQFLVLRLVTAVPKSELEPTMKLNMVVSFVTLLFHTTPKAALVK